MLRTSPLRHAIVLAPLIGIELALAIIFFRSDLLSFALPLFTAGSVSTVAGYALLLRRWPLTPSAWARFGLSLVCAFVAFQISLVVFSIVAALSASRSPLMFILVVLIGANLLFFPAWLLLGTIAFALLQLTNPRSPPRPPLPPGSTGRPRRDW